MFLGRGGLVCGNVARIRRRNSSSCEGDASTVTKEMTIERELTGDTAIMTLSGLAGQQYPQLDGNGSFSTLHLR